MMPHQTSPGIYVDAEGKTKKVLFELLAQKKEHEFSILIEHEFDLNVKQDGMNLLGFALRLNLIESAEVLLAEEVLPNN